MSHTGNLLKVESEWAAELRAFAEQSRFLTGGAVITDLDGTAVHEDQGRVTIPHVVSHALKRLYDQGRPVLINTLRFPANVIATFGREWSAITDAPLPLISLNGSVTGSLIEQPGGDVTFEELEAFPLPPADIEDVLGGVESLIEAGLGNLLLFYYPRDWRRGEVIWTPQPERLGHVRGKYPSATRVHAAKFDDLRREVSRDDICMMLLLVDEPGDKLMAYQHVRPSTFVTAQGVDKLYGWRHMAGRLGLDTTACAGAGDTLMDTFLQDVGLAIHVGGGTLPYEGRMCTIGVSDSHALGALLFDLSELGRLEAL